MWYPSLLRKTSLIVPGSRLKATSWKAPIILPLGNHPRSPPLLLDEHSEYCSATLANSAGDGLSPELFNIFRASRAFDCFSQRICLAFTKLSRNYLQVFSLPGAFFSSSTGAWPDLPFFALFFGIFIKGPNPE